MALMGGVQGETPLPMLGVRTSRMVERAMDELLVRGHRSVVLPLWNRPDAFRDRLREVMDDKLRAAGAGFEPARHMPVSPYDDARTMYGTMAEVWESARPTALLLLDWREFVAVSCFLRDQRIRIPDELSVVVLSHQPTMDCHIPSLAHFEHPVKRMAKTLADWARVYPGKAVVKFFEPRWVDGESVATAPGGA
jgi:DNA-binding LacI/PurR family transcriptional regulator